MSGRQLTPHEKVVEYLQEQIRRRETALLNAFAYVGEACIKEARENGSYIDRTGNLRSSIGYVILRDGAIYKNGGFDANSNSGTEGQDGADKGEDFIIELIKEYRKGFVLIVVAGMEYAAYVEAMNYNVLTSAELLAQQLVPQILKQLGFKTV